MQLFQHLLNHHLQNRKAFRSYLNQFNTEQVNNIPAGFNNNIIWNCAHVITVQQFFIYTWCGKTPVIDKDQYAAFGIGTKPEKYYDDSFVQHIKEQLIQTSVKMAEDLNQEDFQLKKPFLTSLKTELNNPVELLSFVNYHEGMHLGAIISLSKLV